MSIQYPVDERHAPPIFGGILLAAAATLLFSAKGIMIKLAYEVGIDTISLMTLRMLFSLPLYLLLGGYWYSRGRFDGKPLAKAWPAAAAIGVLGYYGASLLDLLGLNYIHAQLERLVLFAYPTLTVLLGWLLLGRRPARGLLGLLPLTWGGVALMVVQDWALGGELVLLGSGLIFGSALLFATYMLLSQRQIARIGSQAFTCIAMIAASGAIVLHYLGSAPLAALGAQPTAAYWLAAAIALFSTVLPSFMFSEAIHRIGAERAALTGSLGPVLTAVAAVGLLGEPFTLLNGIGMAVVIGAVTWMGRAARKDLQAPATAVEAKSSRLTREG